MANNNELKVSRLKRRIKEYEDHILSLEDRRSEYFIQRNSTIDPQIKSNAETKMNGIDAEIKLTEQKLDECRVELERILSGNNDLAFQQNNASQAQNNRSIKNIQETSSENTQLTQSIKRESNNAANQPIPNQVVKADSSSSQDKKTSWRVPIAVALIGMAGTVSTALISQIDLSRGFTQEPPSHSTLMPQIPEEIELPQFPSLLEPDSSSLPNQTPEEDSQAQNLEPPTPGPSSSPAQTPEEFKEKLEENIQSEPQLPVFDRTTAIRLIESWGSAKQRLFAPPYDENVVYQYTTGKLKEELLDPSGNPVRWLSDRGWRYYYQYFEVTDDWGFDNIGNRGAVILAKVRESRTLYDNFGNIVTSQSRLDHSTYRYFFEVDTEAWKILDYCTCKDESCTVCIAE